MNLVAVSAYLDHGAEVDGVSAAASSEPHTGFPGLVRVINRLVVPRVILAPAAIRVIKPLPCVTVVLRLQSRKNLG